MDIDTIFNTSGKIPTESNFWNAVKDRFVASDGITPKFGRVIAEQMFRPLKKPFTPFYNEFVSKPLEIGAGWTERAVAKDIAKHLNPKASAEDALKYYESEGIEKVYEIDYSGWRVKSVPSELYTVEEMIEKRGIAEFNNLLVDSMTLDYQRDMESAVEKKLISMTKSSLEVDATDFKAIEKLIRTTASKMRGDKEHFNELTSDENGKIYTNSSEVLCFMPETLYNDIVSARADLPSPEQLVNNARVITVPDALATPLSTSEWTKGNTAQGWSSKPVALDQPAPLIYMCSSDKCAVRPVIRSYITEINNNGAGGFYNVHMRWRAAIGVRPWENGVRINAAGAP